MAGVSFMQVYICDVGQHRTRRARVVLPIGLLSQPVFCQQAAPAENAPMGAESKPIFWIIPNFRLSPMLVPYKPITPSEPFRIATLDPFDRETLFFGAEAGLTVANRSFGQGVRGYAHYFAASYADNDPGRGTFNFSEIAGNSTAVAISTAYSAGNRDAADALSKLGSQLGVDMASMEIFT
jgi:hypothetical protein